MENSNSESATDNYQLDFWKSVLEGNIDKNSIVTNYLTDKIQFSFFNDNPGLFTSDQINEACLSVVKCLKETPVSEIRRLLAYSKKLKKILPSNIPQFSNFASATICVPDYLIKEGRELTYKELGYLLFKESKSDGAATKFGENHGKLAVLLDLATLTRKNGSNVFKASILSESFYHLNLDEKMELLSRLCYRIPIIQHAAVSQNPEKQADYLLKNEVAESTYLRRRPNVLEVLAYALGE